jgi:exodeoxyribonuclease-3
MNRIASWNVNGIRAAARKGLLDTMVKLDADVVCLQEVKALPEQLPGELLAPEGYHAYFAPAERKGYSGVATYCKERPVRHGTMEVERFDVEGRLLVTEFDSLVVVNAYFPNSQENGRRLPYKLDFGNTLRSALSEHARGGKPVVLSGDYNIAHTEIDLERPKENEQNPGYLPEEREWMTKFLDDGWVDTFRMFTTEPRHYTWWSYRAGARERNVGWRIDYHCVPESAAGRVTNSYIRPDIHGSDHCPVVIEIE